MPHSAQLARWHRVNDLGARPRRPLRASTETKNPSGSDIPYVNTLPAPFTVNTVPEGALRLSPNTRIWQRTYKESLRACT